MTISLLYGCCQIETSARDLAGVRARYETLAQEVTRVAAQAGAAQARGRSMTVAE